jgi:hypothetical protein
MASKGTPSLGERARLLPLLRRFPKARAALQRLFRDNPSFQSLCEDYRDCLAALQYWEQSASGDAPALAGSYAELLGELEQEVRQFLKDNQTFRSGGS